jgi:hypothetical protein
MARRIVDKAWSRRCRPRVCSAGSESVKPSSDCSLPPGTGAAACWSSGATRASASPRSWSTPPRRPTAFVDDALSELEIFHLDEGSTEVLPAAGLFVFIGATPHTDWLGPDVQRNNEGFVLVGNDVDRDATPDPKREQLSLETSLPGVFAIGDVRAGSVKRVATAVGDAAAVVAGVRQYVSALPVGVRAGR